MSKPLWTLQPAPSVGRCAVYRDDRYVCETHADDAHRIVACANACEGIPTSQLEAMNATGTGLLSVAYDVCSQFWEAYGEDLVNDEPISGGDAVETLCLVGDDIRRVVAWACKPDVAYLAVGRFDGVEQIWRGGVYNSEAEAEEAFNEEAHGGTFVRTVEIKVSE